MTDTAQNIQIAENFAASKQDLFKAWTEEESLKQWWRPMDKELVSVENDIRQGGKVVYTFSNDLKIHGEYKEVQGQDKLVYSWIWDFPEDSHHKGEYLLTVGFSGDDSQSKLDVKQENFKSEHSIKPHEDGWKEALESLKAFLEKNK